MKQYIGARYVPKFYSGSNGDNWDSGVAYEPLTIVGYLTNFYCSKKPVPPTVGAPNLNGEYWANIGLFGDVENRVQELESDVSTLETSVGGLDTRVGEAETDINELGTAVTANTREINNLKSNKKFIFIGDSYNLNNAGWNGWGAEFKSMYTDYTVYDYSQGGAGFVTPYENRTFINVLNDSVVDIADGGSIDGIVVLGGYNDASMQVSQPLLQNALENFVARARELYPNAKIYVGFIGANNLRNDMQQRMFTYNGYYKAACLDSGAIFIDNINYTLLDSNYILNVDGNTNTGSHPNTAGNHEVAKNLFCALNNMVVKVKYGYNYNNRLYAEVCNNLVTINGYNPGGLYTGVIIGVLENGVWYDLTEMGGAIIWGDNGTHSRWQGMASIVDSTGNVSFVYIRYQMGKLQCMMNAKASFGTEGQPNFVQLPSICGPTELFY